RQTRQVLCEIAAGLVLNVDRDHDELQVLLPDPAIHVLDGGLGALPEGDFFGRQSELDADRIGHFPRDQTQRDRQRVAGAHAPHENVEDRKSTRLNSSHLVISYAVFCLKKKMMTAVFSSGYLSRIALAVFLLANSPSLTSLFL